MISSANLPIADILIIIPVLLVAILVVQIMTYRVMKSFQEPKEPIKPKESMPDLHLKDLR